MAEKATTSIEPAAKQGDRASTIIQESTTDAEDIFGDHEPKSPLNARGHNFNPRVWATNFSRVAAERGQVFRQVGICFQDLNVFGYVTPTDF